tara:strand:- start:2686 stop:2856 length:171 start_codon:yes stop_codon:yes gene_type:complete
MNKWNEKDRAAVRTWAKGEGMLGVIGKAMCEFMGVEEEPEVEVEEYDYHEEINSDK